MPGPLLAGDRRRGARDLEVTGPGRHPGPERQRRGPVLVVAGQRGQLHRVFCGRGRLGQLTGRPQGEDAPDEQGRPGEGPAAPVGQGQPPVEVAQGGARTVEQELAPAAKQRRLGALLQFTVEHAVEQRGRGDDVRDGAADVAGDRFRLRQQPEHRGAQPGRPVPLRDGQRILRPSPRRGRVAGGQLTAVELKLEGGPRGGVLVGYRRQLGQQQGPGLLGAGQPPFHQRAERDRLDPPVRPVAVKLAEHGVQGVAALPRVTGGAERERQLEEQRRPLLLRPGPHGKQPERRSQPLRGGPRCLRPDGAGRLRQQADRAEVTELGRPLDVMGLLGQRGRRSAGARRRPGRAHPPASRDSRSHRPCT